MATDAFHTHFGPDPSATYFTPSTISAATNGQWTHSKLSKTGLGKFVQSVPEGATSGEHKAKVQSFLSLFTQPVRSRTNWFRR